MSVKEEKRAGMKRGGKIREEDQNRQERGEGRRQEREGRIWRRARDQGGRAEEEWKDEQAERR